jgi:ribosome-associated protein
MDIRKLQRAIVDGLEDVKAQGILVFNTEELSPLFERVIIASGTSNRQAKALASSVRVAVKKAGLPVLRTEGEDNGEWIIVDCGAAVAHIMQPAIRDYYRLEEIWGGKPVRLKLGEAKVGLVKASEPDEDEAPAKTASAAKKAARPRPVATAASEAGQMALKGTHKRVPKLAPNGEAAAKRKAAGAASPSARRASAAPAASKLVASATDKAPRARKSVDGMEKPAAPRKPTAPRKVSVGTATPKVRTLVVNAPSKKAAAKRAGPGAARPAAKRSKT